MTGLRCPYQFAFNAPWKVADDDEDDFTLPVSTDPGLEFH